MLWQEKELLRLGALQGPVECADAGLIANGAAAYVTRADADLHDGVYHSDER